MTVYCNLSEAKAELKASGTVADDRLMRHIMQVSKRIDKIMNPGKYRPYFAPYYEQREYPVNNRHIDSYKNTFFLGQFEWLFTISTVTLDSSTVTSSVTQCPSNARVFNELRFSSFANSWYTRYQTDTEPAYVTVTGFWGFHGDYDNAWVSVDALAAGITAAATTLTVANIDGTDPWGFTPRIARGSLLKIGDEILDCIGTDTSTDTATVRRAQNGTTAAAHSLGDAVYVWYPEETVKRITARQAAMLYTREGAFQVETVDGVGTVSYPEDLLLELKNELSEYFYG